MVGLGVKAALLLLLLVAPLRTLQAAVREVGGIGLTVGDLEQELDFYTRVLPFELVSRTRTSVGVADDLYRTGNTETRSVELRLGEERVTLTQHHTNKGTPIPLDSQSYDHWFQHIAIVVRDMDQAYEQLRQHRVKHVSTAPQTLPEWNKNAGGIKAFYFRDPEDHVLEISGSRRAKVIRSGSARVRICFWASTIPRLSSRTPIKAWPFIATGWA